MDRNRQIEIDKQMRSQSTARTIYPAADLYKSKQICIYILKDIDRQIDSQISIDRF